MKKRLPVNLHFGFLDRVPPFAQRVGRKPQAAGILASTNPASVNRFYLHRPERLQRRRAGIHRYGIARSLRPLATLPLLPALLLPTRILQGFRMFAGFLLADQMLHPAFERLGRQPVLAATLRALRSALTPRLDVQRPITAVRFYPGPRCHRRSSHVRENPIWNDTALSEIRARFGRLQTNGEWQGKSIASGPAYMVDGVEILRNDTGSHAVAAARNLKQIKPSSAVGHRKRA